MTVTSSAVVLKQQKPSQHQTQSSGKQSDTRAMEYLQGFPLTNPEKLVSDFNQKIINWIDLKFINEVTELLKNTPGMDKYIGFSDQPNYRGIYGLVLKNQEAFLPDYTVAMKYQMLHNRAKQKGIPFDLELKDIKRLYRTKKCFYTGVYLTDNDPALSTHRTFDRVDNTKGYTKDNVVVCSHHANQIKSHLFENPKSLVPISIKDLLRLATKLQASL